MMYYFGKKSTEQLSKAHPKLQLVFNEVIKNYDCSVLQSVRGEVEQNEVFRKGLSKLKYPDSKHNTEPSLAVDVVPYPIDWNDIDRFVHFAGYVKGVADSMGIKIRCGCDWDSDNDLSDQSFMDYPHFELIS